MCLRASKFPTPAKLPEEGTMPEAAASLRTNWLEELIILRPGWFTDGKETGTVRAAPSLPGAYTISRRDVGWFITEECLKGSNKWVGGEGVVIAY
ncbi:hypothetical protein CALVIDRAFT_533307 [Calocera viscosa TUFC12733]|uniref:NAD(P)-binding domain-containing protein n=1 Tax=Calocera viscosa (strain TUFC12733) TaxID=1330018 RepID=A0A167RK78_CALVF|nr:hypothetical protein CALVIDRAFT_533307 [Calocera viscosa TUFC12733]